MEREASLEPNELLIIFIGLKIAQLATEHWLAFKNKQHYLNEANQQKAMTQLGIPSEAMQKTTLYSLDKYRYSIVSSWVGGILLILFLAFGGLGMVEDLALASSPHPIGVGLVFIGGLGLLSALMDLPFSYYFTFKIEEKHGFNKQTRRGFFVDRLKGVLIAIILGGGLLSGILAIMEYVEHWWIFAFLTVFTFNLLIVWIYPTFLAPLFNKFEPLKDGELKDKLFQLAKKVQFNADSISVMNASIRSTHGNAYFTGVFGKKKIVLFDTLLETMTADELTAVLAHELGHFKLHHIRFRLIRGFFLTGLMFFGLHLMLPFEPFYHAFHLSQVSSYGALVVFSMWLTPISFLFQPLSNSFSRRDEFAADAFALQHTSPKKLLGSALLKLRERSQGMPVSHPLFSKFYHSHPPLLERLEAMGYTAGD